ncbi:MAG: hypothetical protein ACXWJM_13615 [Ramlibacter sp.]
MNVDFRLNDLNAAIAAEYAVTAQALQEGLLATKPLSATRLRELCALGEKMMQAKMRTADAHAAARTWIRRERLDIILPDLV